MKKPLKIAVIQNDATLDLTANLSRLEAQLALCRNADLVALPEVFAIRGSSEHYKASAQSLNGPLIRHVSLLAKKLNCWILAGTIIERAGRKRYNTSVLLDRRGRIRAVYRKIHLFEARLDNGRIIREADDYSAGKEPTTVNLEGWQIGLAICYDLRFPEIFRVYSAMGADLMLVPSNFTARTGRDHWEVLIKARAIENQCFVAAPNQCGTNRSTGVASYGHSCIVGPWGETLAIAGKKPKIIRAVLDPSRLREVRHRIPALKHRRMDLFPILRRKCEELP